MAILVAVVVEEFGAGLTRAQFNDVMLAIFEHNDASDDSFAAVSRTTRSSASGRLRPFRGAPVHP
jgi:hypothetical protein